MAFSTGTIAQGCFGKVYKEKYNDTWAAVKKVPQHLISRKDLERECEVYNKANHPNIVKLLGNITLRDGKWVIPLEFIFGEDLETTIFKASKSKIQLTAAAKGTIIVGMCEGLLLLHSKDIVHQDLKPENIMVEHNTNRAVIIDLGLAKFFKRGLNSAIDMGNEAYSAPEVLQRCSQRSQRSDVWAMGKIIAELCARIRLYTPSVCPEKIKEVLKDQPYCSTVCRMVEQDPTMRASMGGVISDLRRAADSVANVPIQKEHLKPPVPQINARSPSPSPLNRDPSPGIRDKSPGNLGVSPGIRDISPGNRGVSPGIRDISPGNRGVSPGIRDISPGNRGVSPGIRDISPGNRGAFPLNNDPFPLNKFGKNQSPPDRPPGAIFERLPRPEMKALPRAGLLLASPPKRQEDRNRIQDLAPKGGTEIAQDLMKMKLLNEAAKDLPCNLPATGRVVVRRFEEKNGQMGTWEQTEVVTRDGKIVKYDDVKFNSR